jgi:ligand-binding sensor domain-containing protein/two-component sensor histidine kinase
MRAIKLKIDIIAFIVGILSYLFLNSPILALDPNRPITQYGYSFWTIKHGLPDTTIWSIAQTLDGYIWLGTPAGLVRFDGVRFTSFNFPSNKEATVENLWVGKDGSLWICSYNTGLSQFKDGQLIPFTKKDGLSSNRVTSFYQDQQGNIWIGNLYSGLDLLKDNRVINYKEKDGLSNNQVTSITEDNDGALWIATNDGISKLKDGHFTNYGISDGLPDHRIKEIIKDRNGNIWIATAKGLVKFKDNRFITYTTKDGLSSNKIDSIVEDSDGNLWIGTEGSGLNRLTGETFTAFTTIEGLSSDDIRTIFEDREKNIWIGTRGGGLCLLKERQYTLYTIKDGLANNHVKACVDDNGTIWCGTLNGLSKYKDGKFITYTTEDGLIDNDVIAITRGLNGSIWIGTTNGLNKLQNNRFTYYTTKDGLASNKVTVLHASKDGTLWIGSKGTIQKFKDGKFNTYSIPDSDAAIKVIYEDSDNNIWFGGGGLNLLKDGQVTTYTTKDGLSSNIVRSIYRDKDGALWIGTRKGLDRFKDEKFISFSIKDGLIDDRIIELFEDGRDNFWISSRAGMSRISRKELNDYAEGRLKQFSVHFIEREDGNRNVTHNGAGDFHGCKSMDGKIWFPSLQGLVVVDPYKSIMDSGKIPVHIEEIIVDNRSIEAKNYLQLSPSSRDLEIHYTGVSFVSPENLRFKYKLQGFDKDWIDAGNRRAAYYTNLPPGNYSFKVIARNNDGVWDELGDSFNFYLPPHFYQTYWFYALCLMPIGLIAWGVYLLRMKHVQSQFSAAISERTRIARELHDTLLQDIAGIALKLELVNQAIERAPTSAKKELEEIITTMDHCQIQARRSIENLRSTSSDNYNLESALENLVSIVSLNSGSQVHLEIIGLPYPLPKSIEENLIKICQEAVSNAVKHGKANYIEIELMYDPELIELRICDDGSGFDINMVNKKGHYGITGMRERAAVIGGTINISSQIDVGTQIVVEIPVGRS